MALEAVSSNELLNFIIYDTISATPFSTSCNDYTSETTTGTATTTASTHPQEAFSSALLDYSSYLMPADQLGRSCSSIVSQEDTRAVNAEKRLPPQPQNLGVQQGRKKRRRRPRVCKNKEEAETQRMTHIAVERNRRKQMNEHLAVLRSLIPESYVQRGDQASIVGGAIEFVKELEHLLQNLEAKKFLIQQQQNHQGGGGSNIDPNLLPTNKLFPTPFSHFFGYPQYTCSQISNNKHTFKTKASIADIEVTLIETHANLRILSRKRLTQLSKMVACFRTLYLSILHLNVTTLEPLVLYSISAKVEDGCELNSADDIAGAVHQMLRIIEDEATTTPSLSC